MSLASSTLIFLAAFNLQDASVFNPDRLVATAKTSPTAIIRVTAIFFLFFFIAVFSPSD